MIVALKRWLPFTVGLIFVGLVILSADMGWFLAWFARVNAIPLGDKAGHFVLIGALALLFNRSLNYRTLRLGRVCVQLGGLTIAVLITLEEFTQIWIPNRMFSLGDLTANYAGILCADLLARILNRRSPPPERLN